MPTLWVVPSLAPGQRRDARLGLGLSPLAVDQFALHAGEEPLAIASLYASPTLPIEGCTPIFLQRLPKAMLVYWLPWSLCRP